MEKTDLPPPYEPNSQSGAVGSAPPPPVQQPPYPEVGYQQAGYQQAGYPATSQPGYPPSSRPSYPPSSQPSYPPTSQPGYQQQGYPPQPQSYGLPPKDGYNQPPPPPGYMPPPMMSHQQNTNTTVVVTGQPMMGGIPPQQIIHDVPPNYMALSWIVCLFCCWPLGIAAIMASSRVDSAVAVGNMAYAHQQSRRARTLSITAIVSGIIIYIILVIRIVVLANMYS